MLWLQTIASHTLCEDSIVLLEILVPGSAKAGLGIPALGKTLLLLPCGSRASGTSRCGITNDPCELSPIGEGVYARPDLVHNDIRRMGIAARVEISGVGAVNDPRSIVRGGRLRASSVTGWHSHFEPDRMWLDGERCLVPG